MNDDGAEARGTVMGLTSIVVGIMSRLRARGQFDQSDVDHILESALTLLESSPDHSSPDFRTARSFVEGIAQTEGAARREAKGGKTP